MDCDLPDEGVLIKSFHCSPFLKVGVGNNGAKTGTCLGFVGTIRKTEEKFHPNRGRVTAQSPKNLSIIPCHS